ncbi:MAG TPA: alpha/beta fold hydrolase [Vicinamibacterales bacterium]|nr:alpha/beta fold hydrolase [Vicinamibacterales bacterium]
MPVPKSAQIVGIPPVPRALADAIAPYASFRQAVFASWHPAERQMLVNTRLGDAFQAYRIPMPQGEPVQMTFQPRAVGSWTPGLGSAWFAEGGQSVVFRQDQNGNQLYQLYKSGSEREAAVLLTDGKSRNGAPVWSTRGDRFAYYSTRRDNRDRDLWVMNPSNRTSDRMVAQVSGAWDPVDWSNDDRYLVALETVTRADTRLWQIDVESGEKKRLTPEDAAAYGGGIVSADGKRLYITTDAGSEFRRLASLDIATGTIATITARIHWDVEDLALSPDGRWLAFTANEAGVGTLYLFDTRTGGIKRAPNVPPGSVQGLEWRPNSDELAFNLTSPQLPWNAYSLVVSTGKVSRWTRGDTGAVNTTRLADAQLITWKSFDGLSVSGFMYRPPATFTGRRPVLINIHGGPEAQERPRFLGRSNYLLNELGMVVIYPNIRGSTGFGKSFLALDNGRLRENAVKDLGALLDWIGKQRTLDKTRVTIAGPSYGGLMALAVAATYPDRVRCVFDGFGISNIATFLERAQPSIRPVRRGEYGDESDPAMREFMNRMAPVNQAAKIRAPLFIVHGKNDPAVPVEESEQMVAAVKKTGTPLWVMYATNAGHGFADNRQNDEYSFYAWVLFMKQYMQLAP